MPKLQAKTAFPRASTLLGLQFRTLWRFVPSEKILNFFTAMPEPPPAQVIDTGPAGEAQAALEDDLGGQQRLKDLASKANGIIVVASLILNACYVAVDFLLRLQLLLLVIEEGFRLDHSLHTRKSQKKLGTRPPSSRSSCARKACHGKYVYACQGHVQNHRPGASHATVGLSGVASLSLP